MRVRIFREGVALSACVATLAIAACGGSDDGVEVPAEIRGTWMTDAALFQDRAFEITDSEVFFQTGPKDYTLHKIQVVEATPGADGTSYELEYRGVSGERERFRFRHNGNDQMHFENRPQVVWTRGNPDLDWPWKIPG